MRVCVTGSGGFIGQTVIRQLVTVGHEPVEYTLPTFDILSELDVNRAVRTDS